jgi:hypothetical protein
MRIPKLLHEPLLHFLLAGLGLFLVMDWLAPANDPATDVITVDESLLSSLARNYATQMGVAPGPEQLEQLAEDYIRDEILYREALRAGLDRNDDIVRRRLIQKMEYINSLGAGTTVIDAASLQAFHRDNPALFMTPALVSFEHRYYNPDLDGAVNAKQRSAQDLIALDSPAGVDVAAADRFPLQDQFARLTPQNAAQLFGNTPFTEALFTSTPGQWAGPLRSGYGWHLLFIRERTTPTLPDFADIRDLVELHYREHMQSRNAGQRLQELRARYRIERDDLTTDKP